MNGAERLVRTLVAGDVDTCFANPGTSEMHFVSALDRVEGIRCILTLFEGVATGAADGYARMTGRPAATLLHLGPGVANGLSNLHNGGRAAMPMVNIVGDHASYHRRLDAPLTSDIEGAVRPFSHWVRTTRSADEVAHDGAAAIAAARTPPGRIATLILPADAAWSQPIARDAHEIVPVPAVTKRRKVTQDVVLAAAKALRGAGRTALFLTGEALQGRGLELAGSIAEATGARLIAQTFNALMERGAGRVAVERLPYAVDSAVSMLAEIDTLILVGAKEPVAFFAYPDKPGRLSPAGCRRLTLAELDEDIVQALANLGDELDVRPAQQRANFVAPEAPKGQITPEKLGALLCRQIPENAILVDEAVTTGRVFYPLTRNARAHHWIQNLGGSIGYALPVATGAAVACPDRKVVCLESDGSGMYMPQSLWTQARENLDVTTLLFSNRAYRILMDELSNVGAQRGPKAHDMMSIDRPVIDWAGLAGSMGVRSSRAGTMEDLEAQFAAALGESGPNLIEVVL